MSLFLSKIHYELYDKIHLQEQLTDFLLTDIKAEGSRYNIHPFLYSGAGELPLPPLETVIDTANIHGWLQNRIDKAENRFALLVTALVQDNPLIMPVLEKAAFRFGMQYAAPSDSNAEEAFQYISALLLDGMPCTRVQAIEERSSSRVVWKRIACTHSRYWEDRGGNIELYYRLRASLINGILNTTSVTFTEKDCVYTLFEGEKK
ncbi:hypothetical protein [Treponema pedis]|uniref:hypothetical protein n=1 Tax=Treponema pedis TaxID=409322 RepID=UPI0003F4D79C|nr:hypothetical protein [Treponema pedis]